MPAFALCVCTTSGRIALQEPHQGEETCEVLAGREAAMYERKLLDVHASGAHLFRERVIHSGASRAEFS